MYRRRTWVTAALGAALVVVLSAPVAVPASAARDARARPAKLKLPHDRSGLPWASGVFIPRGEPAQFEQFGAWRGTPVDVALLYGGRETWDQIVKPAWLKKWKDTPFTLVVSTAMLPEDGKSTLARCAAGEYDAKWRRYGRDIEDSGTAERLVIRLGWEFNGLWVPWAAKDPDDWAACWRRVHEAVEHYAPQVRWDWCVNRSISSVGIDPRLAYPGDKYVDIVGIDSFDGYPPATTEAGWQTQHSGAYGLDFWADFARERRKGFSVPEWAVYPGTSWEGAGGGDNPHYIARMMRFFRQNADILSYEIYFDEDDAYQGGALHQNPLSAVEYREQIARMLWADCRECMRPFASP